VLDGSKRVALAERRTAGADASLARLVLYQYGNVLGTALLELDESADILSYEEYHPFGSTALQSISALRQAPSKRYRFTGKERDDETGFYYHGARFYAPWLCRWTSPDPIGIADGANMYSYSGNRPIGSSDPSGQWEMPSWRTVAVIAAVVVVGAIVTVATAGLAGPIIAGAVASVGLTGAAATVATGVVVGAVSGAVAGAASGAAGELTRQTVNSKALGLGSEHFSARRIAGEAASGAKTGAMVGAAIGGAAAIASTAVGAAAIGGAGKLASAVGARVVPAAVRQAGGALARGVAAGGQRVAGTAAGQVVKRGAQLAASGVKQLEQAATQRGAQLARATFKEGTAGRAVAQQVGSGTSVAEAFGAAPKSTAVETIAASGPGGIAGPRTFTSSDPLVSDLANKIEAAYPGHVLGVNVPILDAKGVLITDADILLRNAAIQVKSGSGKGLTTQVFRTEAATGLPTIGYGPNLGGSVVRGIQKRGGLVTRDAQLLIDVVRP
jgi:RHS repeat-associated protein